MTIRELKKVWCCGQDVIIYEFKRTKGFVDVFKGTLQDLEDEEILDREVDTIYDSIDKEFDKEIELF